MDLWTVRRGKDFWKCPGEFRTEDEEEAREEDPEEVLAGISIKTVF